MSARLDALRSELETHDCDAFVSFSPPANEYLTGFRGSTSAVLVTPEAAVFLCDFRYTEQAGEQVEGFEVEEVQGTMETRAGEALARLGASRVAVEPGTLSLAQSLAFEEAFGTPVHPVKGVGVNARQVKSPEEQEKLRAASSLAEDALSALLPMLKEGITEAEFVAQLEFEFKKRGAQGASFDPIALFGSRSSLPHGMPGNKPLERGDIVLLDLGCILESYCSDLTRTFVFGTIPGTWFEEIYHVTLNAQLAALDAIRPGVPCREVDAVARDIISDAGYGKYFGHGLGHGVGLEIHEAPRLNQHSDTILESGMAVTVEPGIYLPGKGGVRIEDLVLVTDSGCEILTQLPKDLKVLD
ncbi:MAG: Xaa-Pro peptidase family protein [Candidatus Hydrogenedentes bacterium]|nr:Xaa-Pro peptidase family protein [Candidatus Hydrogenedentota bacterium]